MNVGLLKMSCLGTLPHSLNKSEFFLGRGTIRMRFMGTDV